MQLNRTKSLLLFLAAVIAAPALADDRVATVNGTPIPQSRMDLMLKQFSAQGQPVTDDLKKSLKDRLITEEIVSQEAVKKGLDKSPEVQTQLEMDKQEILIRAYLIDYVKNNPIGDDEVKAAYDKEKAAQADLKEYKLRHILVEKEQEAKDIIAQLKKGAKFDKIATDKSKDPGSSAKGGDLGWSIAAGYVKPFGDAVMKMKKGEITQTPVQTQFGWHVIKLEDERARQFPSFDEAKGQIQQNLQKQEMNKIVQDLRGKAKVE